MSAPVAFDVKESGTVPVIQHVPAFAWRCNTCGWLGTGLLSAVQATAEAADHVWTDHQIVPCTPDSYDVRHDFQRVAGTDSIDKCQRCEWVVGK